MEPAAATPKTQPGRLSFYPFYKLFIGSPYEGCETGAFMQNSGVFA